MSQFLDDGVVEGEWDLAVTVGGWRESFSLMAAPVCFSSALVSKDECLVCMVIALVCSLGV